MAQLRSYLKSTSVQILLNNKKDLQRLCVTVLEIFFEGTVT